jgi:very-short-patch-repair endonuclease
MPRNQRSTPKIKHQAIRLRKESTPAERKLWSRIRNDQLGVTFRRQHAIGNYIPDFCSPKTKLIIELDGSQHLEQKDYDEERTKYLESFGYKVIRLWNNDVMKNMDGVILTILQSLEDENKNGYVLWCRAAEPARRVYPLHLASGCCAIDGHGGPGGCRAQSKHRVPPPALRFGDLRRGADTRRLRLGVHAAGVGSTAR